MNVTLDELLVSRNTSIQFMTPYNEYITHALFSSIARRATVSTRYVTKSTSFNDITSTERAAFHPESSDSDTITLGFVISAIVFLFITTLIVIGFICKLRKRKRLDIQKNAKYIRRHGTSTTKGDKNVTFSCKNMLENVVILGKSGIGSDNYENVHVIEKGDNVGIYDNIDVRLVDKPRSISLNTDRPVCKCGSNKNINSRMLHKNKTISSTGVTFNIKQTVRFPESVKDKVEWENEIEHQESIDDGMVKPNNGDYMDMTRSSRRIGGVSPAFDFLRALPIKFASRVELGPRKMSIDNSSLNHVYCNVKVSTDVYAEMKAVDLSPEDDNKLQPIVNDLKPDVTNEKRVRKSQSMLGKTLRRLTLRNSKKSRNRVQQDSYKEKVSSLGKNMKLQRDNHVSVRTLNAFQFWKKKLAE